MRKLFTLLLAVAAGVGTMFAWDYERVQIGDLYYNLDATNQTAEVTDGDYDLGEIIIPSFITYENNSYRVTSIIANAFAGSNNITYVYIPPTIVNIGEYAFSTNKLKTILFNARRCTNLPQIISNQQRDGADPTSIRLGDSVEYLPNYFYENLYRSHLHLPKNLREIGPHAIDRNISSFSVDAQNEFFSADNHFLYNKNQQILIKYANAGEGRTNVNIPEGITLIAKRAFNNAQAKTVFLPESLLEIGEEAFVNMFINRISIHTKTPPTISYSSIDKSIPIFVPLGSLNTYKNAHVWKELNIRVINMLVTANCSATSAHILIGDTEATPLIASCGVNGDDEFTGNVIEYIGLEPNSTYNNVLFYIKTIEGDYDTIHYSFTTTALTLTTKPSKTVSATTAILLAETNMSDAEVSCGFEYKRNDAPADMAGTKVFCPVASGQMAGRLKNLKDDVYYKYRAFYQSKSGNMYYGDWQYIFTGDNAVEFDPILYTYTASVVTETGATLSGYALAGSEDFTEQGFEYWAESRVNVQGTKVAPRRMPAALNEHFFVQANGIKMTVTLTNLDEGTVYKYRAYGKVGNQYYYGSEQTFTTQGEWQESQGIEEVPSDPQSGIKAQKILRDGQIFILRGEKTYTIDGRQVR